MVKEDAVIYLFSFGLYVLLSFKGKKMKLTGLVMIILSIVYFIFAMNMIELAGGKPMLSRFNDYYNSIDGDGFLSILKTIFYDFGYLIKRCFTATYSNEPVAGKIVFLLWVFLPLLFAPFMNKKLGIYVLLVPMGVINLMQYWPYQYNIDFQYTFGSMSLVLFMAIFAIASFNEEKKRLFLYTSLALSFVFFFSVQVSDVTYYDYYYRVNRESFEEVNTLLKEYRPLLKDASVTAEDFLVPELYYVNDLHAMYYYNERPDERLTEYYVINTDSTSQYPKAFLNANYDLVASVRFVNIYKLKDGITPNA